MLGISDVSVLLAYVLLFVSTIGCIVYGLINWNREGQKSPLETKKEGRWRKNEIKLDDEVSGSTHK